MASLKWSREQLKLAFYLYCQLPFGRLHKGNPEIIALANLIGRTPSAVALKLVNFASLDPNITASGCRGMGNSSALDQEVWDEFNADWEGLAVECEEIRHGLQAQSGIVGTTVPEELDDALADYTGETRRVTYEQRIKQSFFRKAVLSSYGEARLPHFVAKADSRLQRVDILYESSMNCSCSITATLRADRACE